MRPDEVVGRFFGWWGAELKGWVPGFVRNLVSPGPLHFLIDLSDDEVVFGRSRGRAEREIGRFEITSGISSKDRRKIDKFRRRYVDRETEVVLRLPRENVLTKVLLLPSIPERELRAALHHQIDRQTPFRADGVYFDYSVIERDRRAGQTSVEIVVVPKNVVDQKLALLEEWGLRPTRVGVADQSHEAARAYNFLPPAPVGFGARLATAANFLLVVVLAGLIGYAVYLPLSERQTYLKAVRAEVVAAQADASKVSELQTEIKAIVEDLAFFADLRTNTPTFVSVLNELTRILPDHTWLTELQVRDDSIRIAGFSQASASLIPIVEQSPLFDKPRFPSPVVQDPLTQAERFSMSFQLVRGGQP